MTYIVNIDDFNKVRIDVSNTLKSEKKINNTLEGKLAWAPVESALAKSVKSPYPNYRPTYCYNPFTGRRFTTDVEAKEFVSGALKRYPCKEGDFHAQHWKIMLTRKIPAFSYYKNDQYDKKRSLFIKFHLKTFYHLHLKKQTYKLEVLSFHPSHGIIGTL